ncbi:MAG: isochorismate synthase [Promicromonosporaceae bacterium]|nr:isochorismate synthase [Promicromonosporaceae bacterium]
MRVSTRAIDIADADPRALVDLLPAGPDVFSWVRDGDGLVGYGVAARLDAPGAERFAEASRWWQALAASAEVEDPLALPGTGLVAFGSFAFDDTSSAGGALVVPRVIYGRRGDTAWVTTITGTEPAREPAQALAPAGTSRRPPSPGPVTETDAAGRSAAFLAAVEAAIARLQGGHLEKVVIARRADVTAATPLDPRFLLRYLTQHYPTTWAYSVDGLVGATPELLLRSERGLVTSRVLAGTVPQEAPPPAPASAERRRALPHLARLTESAKDLAEHRHAVESVTAALRGFCSSMNVPEQPFVLPLPNVLHLATDVTGVLARGLDPAPTSLDLAAALHPSAAVCGTPTATARELLRELEGLDRGRYAGPVGWLGADGDGEWGIALRCAQIDPADPRAAHLFAGCGIMSASDPAAELAESEAKLAPLRAALASANA